jgi:D-arabinose 1-dehydrogenase-like Zn-dependent alcohol dehydrogenase
MGLSPGCATDGHIYLGRWKNVEFPTYLGREKVSAVVGTGPGGLHDYVGHALKRAV